MPMTRPGSIAAGAPALGESERQAAELAAMRRMIGAARGSFSLSVAICNSPALRDYLIGRLQGSFAGLRVVRVPRGTVDVYGLAAAEAGKTPPDGLFLAGLEESIASGAESQPALRSLNASRELWEQRYRCPVVFWLPEYAATLLARHAPDLWRYRSHCFEFVSERAGAIEGLADRLAGDFSAAASLSAEEKRFRIAELEQRVAEAGDPPPPELAHHVAIWLGELGFLYQFVGDLNRGEEMLRKALAIEEKLGRQEGMASEYGNLGVVYMTRGDLEQAEEMFRKSLAINEKLGRQENMATTCGNLGLIYKTRGDLDRAEEMLRKALAIDENLGRQEGVANDLDNLGLIYRRRGDLGRAEEMHRKSLAINEKLGRQEGMANAYGNLGLIYITRGDLERAEEMACKSLAINEKLGGREGIANAYGSLGLIHMTRGDLGRAEEMFRRALAINERLGLQQGMANDFGNLGLIYRRRGDLDRAEEAHRKALAINKKLGRQEGIASQHGSLALVYMTRGDLAACKEHLAKARDLFMRVGAAHKAREIEDAFQRVEQGGQPPHS